MISDYFQVKPFCIIQGVKFSKIFYHDHLGLFESKDGENYICCFEMDNAYYWGFCAINTAASQNYEVAEDGTFVKSNLMYSMTPILLHDEKFMTYKQVEQSMKEDNFL